MWWYIDQDRRDVVVLIIGRQRGFSGRLSTYSNSNLVLANKDGYLVLASNRIEHRASFKADIEGLYRQEVGLKAYRTVLLFATRTGIAGVFLFIRQLLAGYYN